MVGMNLQSMFLPPTRILSEAVDTAMDGIYEAAHIEVSTTPVECVTLDGKVGVRTAPTGWQPFTRAKGVDTDLGGPLPFQEAVAAMVGEWARVKVLREFALSAS